MRSEINKNVIQVSCKTHPQKKASGLERWVTSDDFPTVHLALV